jgi:putative transposase
VWGRLGNHWVEANVRDEVIDFVLNWSEKLSWPIQCFLTRLALSSNRFYDWKKRYQQKNNPNSHVPKSHWLLASEVEAIIFYAKDNPKEGYRRLAYMMLGHTDISYLNIAGTFFYFISVLDGYGRYIVHWELRESMKEYDVESTIQRALEKHSDVKPRIISDNGKQYIAQDFKSFVRQLELTHVTTSPYYPQSNGKLERFHRTLKSDGIRNGDLLTYDKAYERISSYVNYYNTERLHSAIGYVTPQIKLEGKEDLIFKTRKLKLVQAKATRKTAVEKMNFQSQIGSEMASETGLLMAC